ncbi:response regulator [Candidatus Latescibacteria bacterium]|nr:response regulator [Candidatus Latescibacterota bacterium]
MPRSEQPCGRYCNNYGALLSTVSEQVNTPETGDRKKVLIIEDSLVLRMAMHQIRRRSGPRHRRSHRRPRGFTRCAGESLGPNHLRYQHANMDGLEFVDRLRESATLKDASVVMLTSQKSMNTMREAMKKGVFDYILKDMAHPSEFKNRLKKHL